VPDPSRRATAAVACDVLADIGVYSTQDVLHQAVIAARRSRGVLRERQVTVNGAADEASYLFPGASPSMQPFT
jgi:hypothetical protein